jgi:hypothetical protein
MHAVLKDKIKDGIYSKDSGLDCLLRAIITRERHACIHSRIPDVTIYG